MDQNGNRLTQKVEVTFGAKAHVTEDVRPPRELTQWELGVIERLLSKPFLGRDQIRRQLASARVSNICLHCPTVRLDFGHNPEDRALDEDDTPLRGITPFELYGFDADGMLIDILLHVANGYVTELEVYRGDSGPFMALPDPDAFKLVHKDRFVTEISRPRTQ